MKIQNKLLLTVASVMTLGITAQAASVYSPGKGIICDKKSGFCVDSGGISLGLTGEYLGKKHEATWSKRITKDFDTTVFTFSNGLNCDTNKKICKKSKWDDKADKHWTKILFGNHVRKGTSSENNHAEVDFIQAAQECKSYMTTKFPDFPNAAFSVDAGGARVKNGLVLVPVNFKWDEPLVEELGECIIKNGIVKRYHRTSD